MMTPLSPDLKKPGYSQQLGGLGEDLASAEFRRLGFFVFRQTYYNCPFDMVILNPKTGKMLAVEVKTRSTYDRHLSDKVNPLKHDVLAIVDPMTKVVELQYDPDKFDYPDSLEYDRPIKYSLEELRLKPTKKLITNNTKEPMNTKTKNYWGEEIWLLPGESMAEEATS